MISPSPCPRWRVRLVAAATAAAAVTIQSTVGAADPAATLAVRSLARIAGSASPGQHGQAVDRASPRLRRVPRRRPERPRGNVTWSRGEALRVLALTRRQRGKPYVFGAAGPYAFDCSGLVQWVFLHALGERLPRNTNQQWRVTQHISRSQLRPGDLVFVRYRRWVDHVGIYAGGGKWWEAPHTGSHVLKRRIWSTNVVFGRVSP